MIIQPPQHLQVTTPLGAAAREVHVPRGIVLPSPHQYIKVSAPRGGCAREHILRATLIPQSPEHIQVSALSSE